MSEKFANLLIKEKFFFPYSFVAVCIPLFEPESGKHFIPIKFRFGSISARVRVQ